MQELAAAAAAVMILEGALPPRKQDLRAPPKEEFKQEEPEAPEAPGEEPGDHRL